MGEHVHRSPTLPHADVDPPPVAASTEPPRCENCGAPLTGPYCAECGQTRRSPIVSVRAFAAHALDEVANLDSRLLRTLGALFFRPGHLTRAYLEGRRVRYTPPVQLYLGAAAVFFLMASYRPFVWVDPERRQVIGQLPGLTIGNNVANERVATAGPAGVELFAERFDSAVGGVLPVFLVGSVLLFSIVLYAVNRRREPRYIAHAVFALHWTAFYLSLLAVARLFPVSWRVADLVQLPVLGYLALALARVYGQGLLGSFFKAFVLILVFLFILAMWIQAAMTIGMRAV